MNKEVEFEKGLAKYLTEKTGVNIEVYDITNIRLIRNEKGNFISFEGDLMQEIQKGTNKSALTIKISDKNAENLELELHKGVEYVSSSSTKTSIAASVSDENSFSKSYRPHLIDVLNEVVYAKDSKVLSIFDKDNTTFTYTYDGLAK